jgi:hypothetical protein
MVINLQVIVRAIPIQPEIPHVFRVQMKRLPSGDVDFRNLRKPIRPSIARRTLVLTGIAVSMLGWQAWACRIALCGAARGRRIDPAADCEGLGHVYRDCKLG